MFERVKKVIIIGVSVSMLSACAATGPNGEPSACNIIGPKTGFGMAAGAAAGAGIGAGTSGRNKGEAVLLGALAGAIIGGIAGKSMDQSDCMAAHEALQRLGRAKTGKSIVWNNPKTGNHGVIRSTGKATKTAQGTCRPFATTSVINGQKIESNGTTCRSPNGDWYKVS